MYRVYPTERVKGYTHTYCMTEDAAWQTLMDMEEATGVEWAIAFPFWARQKEQVLNALMAVAEKIEDTSIAEQLSKCALTIDKYWTMED